MPLTWDGSGDESVALLDINGIRGTVSGGWLGHDP